MHVAYNVMEYFRFKIFKLMANGKKYLLCFIFHVPLFFLKSLFIFPSSWVDGVSTIVICWLSWLRRGKKTSTLGNPTSTFQYEPHIRNNPHMKPNTVLTIRSLFIVLVPNRDFFGKLGKSGPYLVPILTKSP